MGAQRVLWLACHLPYPLISGGRRREYELLSRLRAHVDVDLCVVSKTFEEDVANAPRLQGLCRSIEIFRAEPPADGATSSVPWQVARHASPAMAAYVKDKATQVDLVHVEGFYLMQHVPRPCPAPVLLVEQNVEFLLCRQRVETARHPLEKESYLLDYLRTLDHEIAAWHRADAMVTVTEEDRRAVLAAVPDLDVEVVPDGVQRPREEEVAVQMRLPSPSVAFVANFAYQPNVDAALYLCRDLLPMIRRQVPDVGVWLVGNEPPDEVRDLARGGIVVTGRVEAVEPYVDGADVIFCPLRIGGGVKVKVLEALARGKAVVTTPVGVQGLGPAAERACIVRDDAAALARSVVALLKDPRRREALAAAATRFAALLPTWDDAAGALLRRYEQVLQPEIAAAGGPSSIST